MANGIIDLKEGAPLALDNPAPGNVYLYHDPVSNLWTKKLENGTVVPLEGAPPIAHAGSHENGGADEIDVTGLSGELADPQRSDTIVASNPVDLSVGNINDGEVLVRSGSTVISQALPVFGQNAQFVQDLAISVTTGTVFQNKLTLTTPSVPPGTYRVSASYNWSRDVTTSDFLAQLLADTTVVREHQQEPQDAGGTFGATGTNQKHLAQMLFYVVYGTAGAHTFELEWTGNVGGAEASIWNATMEFWRIA